MAQHRKRSSQLIGILFGVGAGLLWGIAFVAPEFAPKYNPVEIALGRYLFYGIVSVCILTTQKPQVFVQYQKKLWLTALLFAIIGNLGYYSLLVISIRFIGSSSAALIIGTIPVTVAVVSNLFKREFRFSRLLLPTLLILAGLILINTLGPQNSGAGVSGGWKLLLGLGSVIGALALWTWYGVANATFLKTHSQLSASHWSTMIGVMTLALVVLTVLVTVVLVPSAIDGDKYTTLSPNLVWFIIVSLVLGVAVTWGGTLLWNKASILLPTPLAGQLIVTETVSGVTYAFLIQLRLPSAPQLLAIALIIGGVLIGFRVTRAQPAYAAETPPQQTNREDIKEL